MPQQSIRVGYANLARTASFSLLCTFEQIIARTLYPTARFAQVRLDCPLSPSLWPTRRGWKLVQEAIHGGARLHSIAGNEMESGELLSEPFRVFDLCSGLAF